MREKNKGGCTMGKLMLEYSGVLNKKHVITGQSIMNTY
jgi:hypothetical protein